MNRLTNKNMTIIFARNSCKALFNKIYRKLYKIEDLLEKYNINDIEELEKILKIFFLKGGSE